MRRRSTSGLPESACKRLQQLIVDSSERTVRHNDNHIIVSQTRRQMLDYLIGARNKLRLPAQRAKVGDHLGGGGGRGLAVSLGMKQRGDDNDVGQAQRIFECLLKCLYLSSV